MRVNRAPASASSSTNLFADPLQDRPGQGFPSGEDVARDTHGPRDWQKHGISRGLNQRSATAGLELKGAGGSLSLPGRYLDGQSPIGEFFLDRERYWGLSLVLAR